MDNYKPDEFVLYLEDIDEFVNGVMIEENLEMTPEEHELLRKHWIKEFRGESALILDDQTYTEIMNAYNDKRLSETLWDLVFNQGTVELGWCADQGDFTFKSAE